MTETTVSMRPVVPHTAAQTQRSRTYNGETIGARLNRLRREQGKSQRDLAEPGVTYAYISRIESGHREPSVKALRKLAAKLGVSSTYLEFGHDDDPERGRLQRRIDELGEQVRALEASLAISEARANRYAAQLTREGR